MNFKLEAAVGVAAVLLLSACDSNDPPAPPPPVPQSQLQVIHAVANAPTVAVERNGSSIVSGLAFKEATGFVTLVTEPQVVSVDAQVPGGNLTVIPDTDLTLTADLNYSVIAIGEVGSMTNPIAPLVVSSPEGGPAAGNVKVEVVHAAPNAGPVDIHVTAPTDPIVPADAIAGGNTPFGANSGQLEVAAGDYRIRVTAPGDTTPIFDSGTVALPDGADLLVIAVENTVAGSGSPDASPITLLIADGEGSFEIVDAATPAEVRVVHGVSDAPPVDVYINDSMAASAPTITGLAYTQTFPTPVAAGPDTYAELDAGTNNVLVTEAGNTGFVAIPATDLDLAAGQQYTVYASGTVATAIAPFVTLDDDRSIATQAKVRIVHLAPAADLVDIYVTAVGADIDDEMPTLEDVDFLDDTGYLSLAGQAYDVTVTLADTKTIAIGPATVTLSDGDVYTAVAREPDPNVANDGFGLILLDDF